MNLKNPSRGWLSEAVRLPIAFAQVREDALVDIAVIRQLHKRARIAMVASGGCTAAAIAASDAACAIHLVDPNPAQLALSRLKLSLLQGETLERHALLGHAPMTAGDRKERLLVLLGRLGYPEDALGPIDFVAEAGPDYAGRYERLFLALSAALGQDRAAIEALLHRSNPQEQRVLAAAETRLGEAIDTALSRVLALQNLVELFGEEATQNPAAPFDRHFACRIRHALGTLAAKDNPWLWQMLLGRFPPNVAYPWLEAPAPRTLPTVTWECASMQQALERRSETFDFVHLSNILDWLSPQAAAQTLRRAFGALSPGGCVLVRQLNSSLDIPVLGPEFRWQTQSARMLHDRDRSFFYSALHLGCKQ